MCLLTPAQEEQFGRTCALVREVGFDRVNTAAYSPRPGTPAALRPDQVAELVKLDRLNRLNRVVNEVAAERAQRFLGRDVEVSQFQDRSWCHQSRCSCEDGWCCSAAYLLKLCSGGQTRSPLSRGVGAERRQHQIVAWTRMG